MGRGGRSGRGKTEERIDLSDETSKSDATFGSSKLFPLTFVREIGGRRVAVVERREVARREGYCAGWSDVSEKRFEGAAATE